jgi:hypothetical protein
VKGSGPSQPERVIMLSFNNTALIIIKHSITGLPAGTEFVVLSMIKHAFE